MTAARHRAFIAPRLLGSVVALASFPAYLIARGAPNAIELTVFAWLIAPILIAYFLSRTGRYESAHVLSSLALAGLVTAVAMLTGGIASFAAVWLVVVPLEASLSASRRVVAIASTFALAAAGLLVRNMTDVITRYGRDGAVLFVSPAAQSLFGCGVSDLHGQSLFGRVHVADRPAYLTALGDTAALGESRSVEFRVRRESSAADGRPAAQFVWIEMM